MDPLVVRVLVAIKRSSSPQDQYSTVLHQAEAKILTADSCASWYLGMNDMIDPNEAMPLRVDQFRYDDIQVHDVSSYFSALLFSELGKVECMKQRSQIGHPYVAN